MTCVYLRHWLLSVDKVAELTHLLLLLLLLLIACRVHDVCVYLVISVTGYSVLTKC
jgi:hypothetical protein